MKIASPCAKRRARIEIVPLIDIVFFLLATFVMVSLSMIKNKGINVQLPVASTGESQERKEYVAISLDKEGSIFFNKAKIALEELPARLATLKQEISDPHIFINGDEHATFGRAVTVLDEVRKSGISKIAIETRAEAAE